MTQISKTVYLHSNVGQTDLQDYNLHVHSIADMSSCGYVCIGHQTVTFEVASSDEILQRNLEALRKKQQEVAAEADKMVANIEQTIQKMLALPAPDQVAKEVDDFDDIPF
jgi:hypothetical protein